MPDVFHLLNPSAHQRRWVKEAVENSAQAPWAWVSREHPEHTETLLDWALGEKVRRLIVWGGDGTFNRVVRGLFQRDALERMELCLVPAGTCNDLARRLNLTPDLWRQWEAPAPSGRLRKLTVNELASDGQTADAVGLKHLFVNNAGFGRPRRSFEKKEGSWGVLTSFEPIPLKAQWAAGDLRGVYYMVLACNAPYFSGGLYFEKNIDPEDAVLNIYFVPATSKLRLGFRLICGRWGQPLLDDKITRVRASTLTIEADIPVWPQADGEAPPEEGVRRMKFAIRSARVLLWSPEE